LNVDINFIGEQPMTLDLATRISSFAMTAFVVITAWSQTLAVPGIIA
jgi:hypothetical protein